MHMFITYMNEKYDQNSTVLPIFWQYIYEIRYFQLFDIWKKSVKGLQSGTHYTNLYIKILIFIF